MSRWPGGLLNYHRVLVRAGGCLQQWDPMVGLFHSVPEQAWYLLRSKKRLWKSSKKGWCLTGKGRAKGKCRACGCTDKNSSENGKRFYQVSPEVGPLQVNTWLGKSEALPSHSSVRQIPGAFVFRSIPTFLRNQRDWTSQPTAASSPLHRL